MTHSDVALFNINKRHFSKKAFRSYFISSVAGTVGLSLACFTDAVVAGQWVGDPGLSAFSVCAPMLSLIMLFSGIISVGAGFFVSFYIGENNPQKANAFFTLGMTIGLVISFLYTAISLSLGDELYILLGAEPGSRVLQYSKDYFTIIIWTAFSFILAPLVSICARSDSSPKLAGAASFVGAFINIVLDIVFPIFMENKMFAIGLAGAIGYVAGFFFCYIHFCKKNIVLKIIPTLAGIHWRDVWAVCVNGIGVASFRFYQCIIFICFNIILVKKFGSDQLAVLGILINVNLIVCAVYEGISNAIVSLVSIYRGEMEKSLIQLTMRQAMKYTLLSGGVLGLLLIIFVRPVIAIFGATGDEVIALSETTLKYFAAALIVMGLNTTVTTYAQTMGYPRFSMIASTLRNFILMILFTFVMVLRMGVTGVPLAMLYSEGIVLLLSLVSAFVVMKRRHCDNLCLVENFDTGKTCNISVDTTQEMNFEDICTNIENYCSEAHLPQKKVLLIRLIVEEFAVNIVSFGVRDRKKHFIELKIFENNGDTVVNIRDDVSVYNPLNGSSDDIGGRVLEMIRKKAKFCEYQRKIIFNNLLIRI